MNKYGWGQGQDTDENRFLGERTCAVFFFGLLNGTSFGNGG